MTDFKSHWSKILQPDGTQSVDVLTSFSQEGINYFLERHHKLDFHMYKREFKKVFHSHQDKREFKIIMSISKPLQVQFPPFPNIQEANDPYVNVLDWQPLESSFYGPELVAPAKSSQDPNLRVYCNEVNITIEWPKLNSPSKKWTFTLNPFNVYAEAYLQLDKDDDGHFITIIPTLLKLDINRQEVLSLIQTSKENAPSEIRAELDECEEKFTDLFIISANIAATEQTPKLVRNVKIPIPVIADRPVLPALLNLSDNIITAGFSIDKQKIEKEFEEFVQKGINELEYNIEQDIEKYGGLIQLVSSNYRNQSSLGDIQYLTEEEIDKRLVNTNEYLAKLQNRLIEAQKENEDLKSNSEIVQVNDAYAFGINEYFFDTIISSLVPKPKHECTGWLNLALAKGRVCHWTKFNDADIKIDTNGSLQGLINIDIGGAIEGCVKKIYDCSWEWKCSKLSLGIKGRPSVKITLLSSSGIRIKASFDRGNLSLVTNLPFPFNEIIKALGSIIIKTIEGIINIVLLALSLVVLKPEFALPQHVSKIKLRNLSQFYFERTRLSGQPDSKVKFVGYKGAILVDK